MTQVANIINIDFGGLKNHKYKENWTVMDINSSSPSSSNFTMETGIYYDFSNPTGFPLYDYSIDNYFTSGTIEHMPYDIALFVFKEMFRTLKPGGMIRVVVPDFDIALKTYFDTGEIPDHFPAGGDKRFPITRLFSFVYSRDIFFEPNEELEKKYPGKSGFSNATKKYRCDGTFILKNAEKIKLFKSGHKAAWNFNLMKHYLTTAGFVGVEKMKYNSCSSVFEGKDHDRFTDFGLFAEAQKPEQ